MNLRSQFIEYVLHGGPPICSPQIGAGAGFDTKLAGKEWYTETTLEDTLAAIRRFDIVPLVNLGLPDLATARPEMAWKVVDSQSGPDRRQTTMRMETPVGSLTQTVIDDRLKGATRTKAPVTQEADWDVFEYYVDALLDSDLSVLIPPVRALVDSLGGQYALDLQWPVQPYELLCFADTVDTVTYAMDDPDRFSLLVEKVCALNCRLIPLVAQAGCDFIFLGGPGSEMLSPAIYEKYIIPYSQQVTDVAHQHGLLIYSHICSPIQPFLKMGFYNRMGIDLFETLSPPPVGNVRSLTEAMEQLDPAICTRGNIGLDFLLSATPEQVRKKVHQVIEETRGRKHMVACSDYLFYETPEENIHAMAAAVREFAG